MGRGNWRKLERLLLIMKKAHLFCQYLRDIEPPCFKEALALFEGKRAHSSPINGGRNYYTFADGSYIFMDRDRPGIITAG